ncbi:unnamed protein product [Amaranthus hypochondriacus]
MEEVEGVDFVKVMVLTLVVISQTQKMGVEAAWCVARSGATDDVLQSALDYACVAGADCGPIQQSGLCFLPNTLQAHASYAFNSFYQRNHMAATSCSFSGAATLAQTDPSYGSCVYPASPSTAGTITNNSPTTNPYGTASPLTPTTTSPTTLGGFPGTGNGVNPNYMTPPIPTVDDSTAAPKFSFIATSLLLEMLLFLLLRVAAN